MSTIKFVVEIDEQYVCDHSDPEKMSEKVKEGSKFDFMNGLIDMIGFSALKKDIDGGTTEFTISRDTINPKANGIFECLVGNLATLAVLTARKDEKKEE